MFPQNTIMYIMHFLIPCSFDQKLPLNFSDILELISLITSHNSKMTLKAMKKILERKENKTLKPSKYTPYVAMSWTLWNGNEFCFYLDIP